MSPWGRALGGVGSVATFWSVSDHLGWKPVLLAVGLFAQRGQREHSEADSMAVRP